jgi:hypothetical protein
MASVSHDVTPVRYKSLSHFHRRPALIKHCVASDRFSESDSNSAFRSSSHSQQGVEENIWIEERLADGRLEKTA